MTTAIATVDAGLIDAGDNDRKSFGDLDHLAASIAAVGLAQPPTLRPLPGGRYQIVAGERRTRAMRDILGWAQIPAIVRELSDADASAIMLVENLQRVDLDPMEEARAYGARMVDGATVASVAAIASVPVSRVRSRLALLALSPAVSHYVARRQLPLSFAGAMVELDHNRQAIALDAYQNRAVPLEAFRLICSRLLAEQLAEPMFDPDTFFSVETYIVEAEAAVAATATVSATTDPVGPTEIAQRMGVKATTVYQWRNRDLLPAPDWTISGTPIWEWATIAAWAQATGRKVVAR